MTISNLPMRALLTLALVAGALVPMGFGPAKADEASDVNRGNGDQTTPQTADVNRTDGNANPSPGASVTPPAPNPEPSPTETPTVESHSKTETNKNQSSSKAPSTPTPPKITHAKSTSLGPRSGPRFGRRRVIEGTASFYGSDFHGRRTANGERFNMNAMTLACRRLPMGTRVLVTNLRNGRSITGRVNDLGPNGRFRRSRVADLSRGMARKIGFNDGLTKVRLEVVQ